MRTAKLIPLALAPALALLAAAGPARAWEAQTTHAGLTEESALASELHRVLVERFGARNGLFEPLTIPPADAADLFSILHRLLNPTHGYVPNGRGRLHALGWLVAGAAIADTPVAHAAHHFFDPQSGRGLDEDTFSGLSARVRHRLATLAVDEELIRSGMPATEWIGHQDNPMNLEGFLGQYARAVRSPNPAARDRHLAGALLAAGSLLHVLQDMGSPSHVRNDAAAHYDQVGREPADVGNRFERIASLAYGRLGVPAPEEDIERPSVRAYFTADDGRGLADVTSQSWFSAYTLPRRFRLPPNVGRERLKRLFQSRLRRPRPGPEVRFRAREDRVENASGVCLANTETRDERLRFYMEDDCALEQLAVILPEVSAYGAGLLDTLFRGGLELEPTGDRLTVLAAGTDFGSGRVSIFWDDERGVRTEYASEEVQGGAREGARLVRFPEPPAEARRVAVLFEGKDGAGERLVASGQTEWPLADEGSEPDAGDDEGETESAGDDQSEGETESAGDDQGDAETENGAE